jgi:hypothetical protein
MLVTLVAVAARFRGAVGTGQQRTRRREKKKRGEHGYDEQQQAKTRTVVAVGATEVALLSLPCPLLPPEICHGLRLQGSLRVRGAPRVIVERVIEAFESSNFLVGCAAQNDVALVALSLLLPPLFYHLGHGHLNSGSSFQFVVLHHVQPQEIAAILAGG